MTASTVAIPARNNAGIVLAAMGSRRTLAARQPVPFPMPAMRRCSLPAMRQIRTWSSLKNKENSNGVFNRN